jgi:predicted proteasome-type protease
MPGETSTIQTEINIRGLTGKLKKNIIIVSNATNDNNFQIGLEFFVQKIINLSEEYIKLGKKDHDLFLSTKKNNFKVSKVYFEEMRRVHNRKAEEAKKIDIDFKQVNLNTEGIISTYKIKLLREDNFSIPLEGYFIFETNHPQKPILKIMGTLLAE